MGYRDCTYYQLFAAFNEILREHDVCIIANKECLESWVKGTDSMMSLPLKASVWWTLFGILFFCERENVGIITVYREVIEEDLLLLRSQVHDDDIIKISLRHSSRNLRRRIQRAIDEFFEKHDVLVALE